MHFAENHCRKFHFGEIDFSPGPNLACGLRYVWDMVLKGKQGQRKIQAWKIKVVAKAVGIESPLMATESEARWAFRAADAAYKKLKLKALLMRTNWLWERSKDSTLTEEERKRAMASLRHERARKNF
jgi:hypothetical protein